MSPRIVIVADDFTGGNAVAANLATRGARVVNVAVERLPTQPADLTETFDVVVVTTSSRHDTPPESEAKTGKAVAWARDVELFSNRIDSTLRGNLSSTTSALLRAVRSRRTQPVVGLCVPAHPAAGRQTVGARQLLNGVRLEDSELVSDPLHSSPSSDVTGLLAGDGSLAVASIPLEVVTGPIDALIRSLREHATTADVIVVDALTEQHLERVATAASLCADQITWVTVDPGPFTTALAHASGLLARSEGSPAPILAISGSATALTRRQLRRLEDSRTVRLIPAHALLTKAGAEFERRLSEQVGSAMDSAGPEEVVLVATVLDQAHVRREPGAARELPQRLARVALEAAKSRPPAGLYLTGGDVTGAVLAAFEATGLAVDGEVVPLAVIGALVGGPWGGTPVVTKGGLVGDEDAAVTCIEALESRTHSMPYSQPVSVPPRVTRNEGES